MPIGQIRQELDYAEIYRQIQGPNGGVARDMLRRGLRVQALARKRAPARTGRLRGSISLATQNRVVMGVNTFVIVVGTNLKYAEWVHDGTGIYARHGFITPKGGKVLAFPSTRTRTGRKRKTEKLVLTPRVRGQKGKPFLAKALSAARGRGSAAVG